MRLNYYKSFGSTGSRKSRAFKMPNMPLPDSSILTNIQVPGPITPADMLFEKKYVFTRSLESRIYTDAELIRLPEVDVEHCHYKEWMIRKRSVRRLTAYLAAKRRPLEILEIGCGNGWLSHQLAGIPGTEVTAMDINFTELQQGARVFSDDPNLHFVQGDIRSGVLADSLFDCILLAASIQYFPSLKKTIYKCLSQLTPDGELHIMDTIFYQPWEIAEARQRTTAYYTALGCPEMADFYFHHCANELQSFHHEVKFKPHTLLKKLIGIRDPFPWVLIRK